MKKYLSYFIYILFLIIPLIQFSIIHYLYKENKIAEAYIVHKVQPIKPPMTYEDFKEFILDKFQAPNDEALSLIHLYFPGVEKKPEFQMMLKNPLPYIELVKKLLADSSVDDDTKYVVIATMMNLDIPHLADLANFANQLLLQSKINEQLVWGLIYNGYLYPKEGSIRDFSFLGHQQLNKHTNKEYVAQVFKNIRNNPNYVQSKLRKNVKEKNIWQIFESKSNKTRKPKSCPIYK